MEAAVKKGVFSTGLKKQKEKYLMLFIVSFVIMMLSFLPRMIMNGGIFTYYGDFNSQQIMFYQHAHDSVQAGSMNWDWGTDLGSSFIGSYSFYLLGSPFFWLTTIFPSSFVPYMIPWLLALKTSVAAVFAYAYIRRFVKDPSACFVGGLLYGCSGFQIYNVFFNHFHDATAVFPLILIGFERLIVDNKKGGFALAMAISAIVSYFFFIGECVFLVVYFFLRCTDKDFRITFKKFGWLIFEAVLGIMLAAFLFLPACMDIIENPRLYERLWGMDMVVYNESVRIPRIFQAFFMLNDMPARINIFDSDRARWASMAGYLPLFSVAGVIAFMRTRKKHWLNKAIVVFMIMACVPILNSSFVMFNASYYARWYYMPILLMCLMTAKVVAENKDDLKKGFWPVLIVDAVLLGIGLLPKDVDGKIVFGKMAKYPELYYIQFIVTALMLAMLAFLIYVVGHNDVADWMKKFRLNYKRVLCILTSAAVGICMFTCVVYGSLQTEAPRDYIDRGINGADNMDMELLEKQSSYYNPQNNFYRIETSPDVDNWCMFWGLSSMRCFHSVVNTSIMDFYTKLGQTRDVASRIETKLYALRSLLSVKYYFDQTPLPQGASPESPGNLIGFKYVGKQNGFRVYENQYYIPMGFAFDNYITEKDMELRTDINKAEMLSKALILDPSTAVKYSDYVEHFSFMPSDFGAAAYMQNCSDRRANSCKVFQHDTNGFQAKIELSSKKLVFFSVPYDKGWKAKVNGKDTEIIKVDYGFMAVPCDEGVSEIHFTYRTRFFAEGLIITSAGIVIWTAYVVWFRRKDRLALSPAKKKRTPGGNDSDTDDNVNTEENTDANSGGMFDDIADIEDIDDMDDIDELAQIEQLDETADKDELEQLDSLDADTPQTTQKGTDE